MVIGHTPLVLQNCGISYHWTSGYHCQLLYLSSLNVLWDWTNTGTCLTSFIFGDLREMHIVEHRRKSVEFCCSGIVEQAQGTRQSSVTVRLIIILQIEHCRRRQSSEIRLNKFGKSCNVQRDNLRKCD